MTNIPATNHFHFLSSEAGYAGHCVSTAGEDDGHGGWTDLAVVGAETTVINGAYWERVYTGHIAITATVIPHLSTITSRPHIDGTQATSALQRNIHRKYIKYMN